jgi:membrane fusion protein (multidrug efflux system)
LFADMELVRARLAQTELRAPFDGQLGLREVSEGAYVSPTTVVAKLTKITPLKVEFSVNERLVYDIKPGTPLTFTWGSDSTSHEARVYAIEQRVDVDLFTMMVRALYLNPEGLIRPGHSANIEMRLSRYDNTIAVPSLAIVPELGRDIVYVYRNGVAEATVIRKGMRTEAEVQVLGGLAVGDTLITTGVMQLRTGMPVVLNHIDN